MKQTKVSARARAKTGEGKGSARHGEGSLEHRGGVPIREIPASDLVAITTVRDEAWRLPFLLAYHRWLGVDRFIMIDNDSTDETEELLSRQHDVTLLRARGPYRGSTGYRSWIQAVLAAAPPQRWNLIVDADELFVSLPWQRHGLRATRARLENGDFDLLYAIMVDCYPRRLLTLSKSFSEAPWERAPWFDAGPYVHWSRRRRRPRPRYYGIRQRLYWPRWSWQRHIPKAIRRVFGIEPPPFIIKAPLFRNAATRGLSIHRAETPIKRRALEPAFLLHYKLDADLESKIDLAYNEDLPSRYEHERFRHLAGDASRELACARSRRFTGAGSLLQARIHGGLPDHFGPRLDGNATLSAAWREIREYGDLELDGEALAKRMGA